MVNEATLQLLCHKTAEIVLSDDQGDTLVLQKAPFTREVPPEDIPADIGTRVRITATVVRSGSPMRATPDIFGDVLIPDRFLEMATSSTH
jgi:hypothetical protein